jgi:hypothetical protein
MTASPPAATGDLIFNELMHLYIEYPARFHFLAQILKIDPFAWDP